MADEQKLAAGHIAKIKVAEQCFVDLVYDSQEYRQAEQTLHELQQQKDDSFVLWEAVEEKIENGRE